MKDLVQKAKELIQRLCLNVKAEWPSFKRLVDLVARLATKKIPNEEIPSAKTESFALLSQTKTILCLGGASIVVLGIVAMRGCGGITAEEELRRQALEQVAADARRTADEQERTRKIAEESERNAERMRARKLLKEKQTQEVLEWHKQELGKLKANKDKELAAALCSMENQPRQIIKERKWPQIQFAALSNLTLAEPLPPELKEFADGVELPLKETFLDVFTSLRVGIRKHSGDLSRLPGLVDTIELNGRVDVNTEEEMRTSLNVICRGLSQILGKGTPSDQMMFCEWAGLPGWIAGLRIDRVVWDGEIQGSGKVELRIRSSELVGLVQKRMEEAFKQKAEKIEKDFAEKSAAIAADAQKKINAINKGEN